jgi:hypothetical protein
MCRYTKQILATMCILQQCPGSYLSGSRHFCDYVFRFGIIYMNMERHVGLCLQTERNQPQHHSVTQLSSHPGLLDKFSVIGTLLRGL